MFSHSLPFDTDLVYKSSVRDDEGGTTASLILNTSLSQEELSNHYYDTEYPAAREGDKATLEVKLLDSASIEALKEEGIIKMMVAIILFTFIAVKSKNNFVINYTIIK